MSGFTIVDDTSVPFEVLIPEARDRQRSRYRRAALIWSLVALLAGGLVTLVITSTSGGSGTSRGTPKPAAAAVAAGGPVLLRPVLCLADPYAASAAKQVGTPPVCSPAHRLTAAALNVTPRTALPGYTENNVSPDPALAGYATATHDPPGQVVLLGGLGTASAYGDMRYLVGPSALSLSARDVESAVAQQTQSGQWIVDIHLSHAGGIAWDRFAQQSFHQLLAIDMGGKVVSAPIIEPTQSSYSSFGRSMEISGALTAADARAVAAAVRG